MGSNNPQMTNQKQVVSDLKIHVGLKTLPCGRKFLNLGTQMISDKETLM